MEEMVVGKAGEGAGGRLIGGKKAAFGGGCLPSASASASTPFNRWHHRVAVFIACATLIVIIAGALVTSEDAGLSVPDWPTSYGHLIRLPPWVGGIVYEHSHRMIAWFTGLCTILIAFWNWFLGRRPWMKAVAFGA